MQEDVLSKLKEPFKYKEIHWRIGKKSKKGDKATALAYLNARDVMKRLDDVLGIDGWQDDYEETAKGRIICRLSVKINDQWISKADGAGETNFEGEKGAMSDAFKRAAVKFGVGRYLYYLGTNYYPIDQWSNFITTPPLPQWALCKEERGNG